MYLVYVCDENDFELFNKEENALNAMNERKKIYEEEETDYILNEKESEKSFLDYKNNNSNGFFVLFENEEYEEEIRLCMKKIDTTD